MSLVILRGCRTKMPVTDPLHRALGSFEQEALVRSVFQRNGEADFNCCQREMILPSLIPSPGILCVCRTDAVQEPCTADAVGGWSSRPRAGSALRVSIPRQVLTRVKSTKAAFANAGRAETEKQLSCPQPYSFANGEA